MSAASPAGAFHRANTVTYLGLLAGVSAIGTALAGRSDAAGALIALAVIADTFDGRFARMFARTPEQREVGAHLDSLSDAIAFGIAPCICLAMIAPEGPAWLSLMPWVAGFAFAACAITRLAFYNVTHQSSKGFIGMPVPVAALVASSVMLLGHSPALATIAMLVGAIAMVMPVPIRRPSGYGLALFVLWPVSVIAMHLA